MSQGQYLGEIQSSYWREGAAEFAQNQLAEIFNAMRMGLSFPFHQKKREYMQNLTFLCNEDVGIDDVSKRVCPHGGYTNIAVNTFSHF